MFIVDFISGIIAWFFQVWEKLPTLVKKEIIAVLARISPKSRGYNC